MVMSKKMQEEEKQCVVNEKATAKSSKSSIMHSIRVRIFFSDIFQEAKKDILGIKSQKNSHTHTHPK